MVAATLADLLRVPASAPTKGAGASCVSPSPAHAPSAPLPPNAIPLEVSARHVHLSAEDLRTLFGDDATLTRERALSQPGEYLSDKRVRVIGAKGAIDGVAVLGPTRRVTQVELAASDCRKLGVRAPVNLSGDLSGAAELQLQGDAGSVQCRAIIARNHIHATPADAARLGLSDGQRVDVRAQSARPLIFADVPVRVRPDFALALHLDTDEANACALQAGDYATVQSPAGTRTAPPPPAATVITEKLIDEARAKQLAASGKHLTFARGTVLTPSARDVFLRGQVHITEDRLPINN